MFRPTVFPHTQPDLLEVLLEFHLRSVKSSRSAIFIPMVLLPKIWAADGFLASASDLKEEPRPISAPRRPTLLTQTPHATGPPSRPASSHPAAIGKTLMTPSASLGDLTGVFGRSRERDFASTSIDRPATGVSGVRGAMLQRQKTVGTSRPPWSVHEHAPPWWTPGPKHEEAMKAFDKRHHGHHAHHAYHAHRGAQRRWEPDLLRPQPRATLHRRPHCLDSVYTSS